MNKWIILVATMLIALVFSVTIGTTTANPSVSNVIISSALALLIFAGFFVFVKSDKTKPEKDYDGLTPTD